MTLALPKFYTNIQSGNSVKAVYAWFFVCVCDHMCLSLACSSVGQLSGSEVLFLSGSLNSGFCMWAPTDTSSHCQRL